MYVKRGLKDYPVKATAQEYERFIKIIIEDLELERSMWKLYCDWGHSANIISIGARHRVIQITQILGDGEAFLKSLPPEAKEMAKKRKH